VDAVKFSSAVALVAFVALFACAIYFGLRARKENFAKNLELHAVDIWPQIQNEGFDFSGLLYGVWRDFSATETGMIVRDCHDQQVGKIVYRMAVRQGWISIETPESNFQADVLPALRQSVALRAASDGSRSLCDFTRQAGGTYYFDAKSLGTLESKPPRGLRIAPVFKYTLNGSPAGASRRIGGWTDRGRMLFVLAMQRQRV
jgi:hypothetical protein